MGLKLTTFVGDESGKIFFLGQGALFTFMIHGAFLGDLNVLREGTISYRGPVLGFLLWRTSIKSPSL
jgi:hypothetical protein